MKIVAASCCKLQNIASQPVWADIQAERPDALVLMGDNIYLDHDHHDEPDALAGELRRLYAAQLAEPHFQALLGDLRQRGAPIIAIYDDHDFLGNNRYGGDHGPALRLAARREFVRAFEPEMTGDEVYRVQRLGPADLFVLDARFHRQAPARSGGNRDAVLGATQWNWLETNFGASSARYRAIVSSTTLHSFGDESWEQYPAAFDRMVKLLARCNGAFVLSGDVHRNAAYDDSGVVELVTSAVARKGLFFGAVRQNYAVLTFDAQRMHVDMRSLKLPWRMKFDLSWDHWSLD